MDLALNGQRRDVTVLGSTGSIGTQAADIVRRNPGRFRLAALASGGGNPGLLADQAVEFGVEAVAVADQAAVPAVREAIRARLASSRQPAQPPSASRHPGQPPPPAAGRRTPPEVLGGQAGIAQVAARPADVVLNAVTGAAGLTATLAALDAGRTLALANKESLIMGGRLVTARAGPGQLVPVDSEHSAIAQCLRGGRAAEVSKLVLTASGGPFLGWSPEQLADVSPDQALAHPTWRMGPLVTVNSATLVNKGLEVIEAHLLFGVDLADIDVVVHRQSVVHSMVEFTDGATIAQASPPDMRIPIALALAWPDRVAGAARPVDWSQRHSWTFEPLDDRAFPAVSLARAAAAGPATAPAVYNAANEECVAAFLAGRIPFTGIVETIAQVLSELQGPGQQAGLDEVLGADRWARARARELFLAMT
jgi:1-deoxy-D-xylulose-5-phosphate reductoisomerase